MKQSEDLWDIDPAFRSPSDWARLLESVRDSLAEYLGLCVHIQDYWAHNEPNNSSWSICSRIKAPLSQSLEMCLVGSLCLTLNRGEQISIDADLLVFVAGQRHAAHPLGSSRGSDVVLLSFKPHPHRLGEWVSPKLIPDENGEWQAFQVTTDLDKRY